MRSLSVFAIVGGAAAQLGNWCAQAPQNSWTVCDSTAALDARSADIVSRLTVDDKILSLVTATKALNSVGLPAYQWWSEGAAGFAAV